MGLLSDNDKKQIKQMFESGMKDDVEITFFTSTNSCDYCADTQMILTEVASLDPRIKLQVKDFEKEREVAEKLHIDKVPGISVGKHDKDFGIRYYGIPSGYEFSTILEDIIHVSKGESDLNQRTLSQIANLKNPIAIKVFITPTCPYCPRAAILSHKLALASPLISAEVVEAIEFPTLSNKYGVQAVPKIVANDKVEFEGALPEDDFVPRIMQAG